VVAALNTVAKWVAKLPALAALEPASASPTLRPAPASPTPASPTPASPTPEIQALPARRPTWQGTKRQRAQVEAEDLLQAQILGEIEAT
jgi:hypothetical protein